MEIGKEKVASHYSSIISAGQQDRKIIAVDAGVDLRLCRQG